MTQGLAPGTILRSRYKIVRLIGEGGAGAVYEADDLRLEGRRCAVKEVIPEVGARPSLVAQAQEQFRREASILARLDHPNLPKVSDFFSEGGRDYLVMDYVPGRDLKELVEEARQRERFLSEGQVLKWVQQLCAALQYLHSQNPPVLHRDIKPSNIKLTPQGQIKLVDFGLVKPLDPDDPRTVTVVRGLGSLPYTPLEQYAGGPEHTDVRSDVYSLGATLYHLLTGHPPVTAQQRFLKPRSLPNPRSLNPRISPRTERVILRAMAMHPSQRPESIAALSQELFSSAPLQPEPTLQLEAEEDTDSWVKALRENAHLGVIVIALLLLAILFTWQNTLPTATVSGALTPSPALQITLTPVP